jgi:hypothetical protein
MRTRNSHCGSHRYQVKPVAAASVIAAVTIACAPMAGAITGQELCKAMHSATDE